MWGKRVALVWGALFVLSYVADALLFLVDPRRGRAFGIWLDSAWIVLGALAFVAITVWYVGAWGVYLVRRAGRRH